MVIPFLVGHLSTLIFALSSLGVRGCLLGYPLCIVLLAVELFKIFDNCFKLHRRFHNY